MSLKAPIQGEKRKEHNFDSQRNSACKSMKEYCLIKNGLGEKTLALPELHDGSVAYGMSYKYCIIYTVFKLIYIFFFSIIIQTQKSTHKV